MSFGDAVVVAERVEGVVLDGLINGDDGRQVFVLDLHLLCSPLRDGLLSVDFESVF